MASSFADLPTPGSTIGGKFRVISQIGQGGMGVVVEAENLMTGKRVAIKWVRRDAMRIDNQSDERFLREARAAARISHPNVVDVYDVLEDGDTVFMVMELLQGEPLSALLARGDTPAPELIGLLLDAMRGVAAAHRKHVIHRDIKPDNVFLAWIADGPQRTPKVLDFGISKLCEPDAEPLTRSNTPMGTPLYMSFEQLQATRDIDARVDVYGFGVILYEALTGVLPFRASTLAELIFKAVSEAPTPPRKLRPDLPIALERVVLKAIAKNRDERYASLDALIDALSPFASAAVWKGASTSLVRALQDTVPSLDSVLQRGGSAASTKTRRWASWLAVVLAAAGAVAWLTRGAATLSGTETKLESAKTQLPAAPVAAIEVATQPPPTLAPAHAVTPAQPPATAARPLEQTTETKPTAPAASSPHTRRTRVAPPQKSAVKQAPAGVADPSAEQPEKPSVEVEAAKPAQQGSDLRAGRPLLKEF